ncbi:MAG: hypothetical protein Kow0098_04930 [Ignavibacteriaceae bacterium]
MKNIKLIILILTLFIYAGCNKDGTGSVTNPIGGGTTGGGNTGGVTIQVQGADDQQGNYIFSLNPSQEATFTTITASVAAEQYEESFDFTQIGQFPANTYTGFLQYPSNVIFQGQQWQFRLVGRTVNGGTDFDVTVNYTIP